MLEKKSGNKGFTLIELMITVSIIAVLAAIAIPLYNNYIYRGKQVEAKSLLMTIKVEQEQFFAENGCYTTDTAPLDPTPLSQSFKLAQAGNVFTGAGVSVNGVSAIPCNTGNFANDFQAVVTGKLASTHPEDRWAISDLLPAPVHCDSRWAGGSPQLAACGSITTEMEY